MKTKNAIAEIITKGGFVYYNHILAGYLRPDATLVIGELCGRFWFFYSKGNLRADNYFPMTQENISGNLGISISKVRNAIERLEAEGLIFTKRIGLPAKTYYCINLCLINALVDNTFTPTPEQEKYLSQFAIYTDTRDAMGQNV